jgi:uncharacterized protein (TIGR02271 family)
MSRTVTALYDTRAEAESAKQRLSSAVDVESARIIDKDNSGSSDQQQGSSLGSLGISSEDRHAYGEGINRGGFLLCAEVDSDEDADEIVRVLEQTSSVDLDDRQNSWKSEGWAPFSGASGFGGGSDTDRTRTETSTTQEERIPIVEEHLNVGKRQVERGGARVRSYVRETPVHEQVNLREEHVSVERRPVNETLGRGALDRDSDMLQERTIEMTETSEVPVVEKEARVTEEMVIRKTAEERTEDVEDTVRRTEVDVDETSGEKRDSAFGFGGGSDQSSSESRADFERTDRDRDR